jgi:EXLDI family protein
METKNEYQKVKLHRTGNRPLAFSGRKVASASTKSPESTRWTRVQVYETDDGKIVVGIGYITKWDGETDCFYVNVFGTRADAVSHIYRHALLLADEIADELGVTKNI